MTMLLPTCSMSSPPRAVKVVTPRAALAVARALVGLLCGLSLAGCGDSGDSATRPSAPELLVRGPSQLAVGAPAVFSTNLDATVASPTYAWDLGDGTQSTAARPSHAYAAPGAYAVRARLRGSDGLSLSATMPVWVGALADHNGVDCSGAGRGGWCLLTPSISAPLWFADAGWGWTATADGQVLYTADGGATWLGRFKAPNVNFSDVRFASLRVGWALGWRAWDRTVLYKTVDGGDTWVEQVLPQATDFNPERLVVLNESRLMLAGCRACYYVPTASSVDGGENWTLRPAGSGDAVQLVNDDAEPGAFPGGELWAIQGSDGSLVRSTDAGTTYTASAWRGFVASASFPSERLGWTLRAQDRASGPLIDLVLSASSDGGNSWSVPATTGLPTLTASDFTGLSLRFVDATTGYLGVTRRAAGRFVPPRVSFFRSTDAGRSWVAVTEPPGSDSAASVLTQALSANLVASTVQGADGNRQHHLSRDGGRSWSPTAYQVAQALPGEQTLLSATHPGYRSVDGGQSWTPFFDAGPFGLPRLGRVAEVAGVAFADASHWLAWSRFSPPRLSLTLDAGRRWDDTVPAPQFSDPQLFGGTARLQFSSPSTAWFMKEGRVIHRSDDGGASWTARTVSEVATLEAARSADFDFLGSARGWVASGPYAALRPVTMTEADYAAVQTVVRRTVDGAASWTSTAYLLFKVLSLRMHDTLRGLAVGTGGAIALTEDGGLSWTLPASPTLRRLTRVHWVDASHAVALGFEVGVGATVLYSGDGGRSWRASSLPALPANAEPTDVAFATAQRGWIVCGFGIVLVSGDGGATWATQATPMTRTSYADLVAVHVESAERVTLVGRNGIVLTTTTGGQ